MRPSIPKMPPPPSPPPQRDEAAEAADLAMRQRRRKGYAATVLSSPELVAPNVGAKTLMGQ